MSNCPSWEQWSRMEDGRLERSAAAGLERHLTSCSPCREVWEWWSGIRRSLRNDFEPGRFSPCPPATILSRYLEKNLPEEAEEVVRSHLEVCRGCAWDWDQVQRLSGVLVETMPRARRFSVGKGVAWAAAVLLAAGGVGALLAGSRGSGSVSVPTGSEEGGILTAGETYRPDRTLHLQGEGGLAMRLAERSVLVSLKERRGNRNAFRLERGEVEISVPRGTRRLEVDVPGGALRDIGTVFTVRVWDTAIPWRDGMEKRIRLTSVSTKEGEVEIEGRHSRALSEPGRRGYLLEDGTLFLRDEVAEGEEKTFWKNLDALNVAVAAGDEEGAFQAWGMLLDAAHDRGDGLMDFLEGGERDGAASWLIALAGEVGSEEMLSRLDRLRNMDPRWRTEIDRAADRIRKRNR